MAMTLEEARNLIALVETTGNREEVARQLGIPGTTLKARLFRIHRRFGLSVETPTNKFGVKAKLHEEVELPHFPDEDLPIESIIDQAEERFKKRRESHRAHTWFPIKFKDDLPIGLLMVGDPHLDDNGCNWPELKSHVRCAQEEGIYGVNIGDSTNNWTGRLMRLYAMQDTSVKTARRMVEWFMLESGIRWLVWILGNHDVWNDGAEILAQMMKRHKTQKLVCHNWEARFEIQFPNGWSPKIYAAHNFKGYSMWNPAHGPMRAGQMGDEADIYVCGDLHQAINVEWENPSRRRHQRFIRVRGYKFMDDYARQLGFDEQEQGCSALVLFDPQKRSTQVYMDVIEGTAILAWKRKRAKPDAKVSNPRK